MAEKESQLQSTIGEALIKEGIIDDQQLQRALRIQQLLEEPKQLSEVLVDLGYAKRQAVTDAIAKHGSGMRIGEMLIEQGIITPESLEMALQIQKERGIKLGEALIELGAVNERTLLRNIAHQNRVPFIEPSFSMVEPGLLKGVSPDYLARSSFLPFSRSEDGLVTVVVPALNNDDAIRAAEELFQGKVKLALGPEEAIKESIEDFRRYRTRDESKELTTGEPQEDPVVQLVNHMLAQAIDEGASDIHLEPMSGQGALALPH